jgi:tetratricopeptide (TPR) repeat protein
MMKRIAAIVLISLFSITAHSQMSPRDRYLSPGYVQGADFSTANEMKNGPRARKLLAEGIALYRQKRDADAIVRYEESLELYIYPETLYHYGNSLSNIGELIYAVRAYEYAINLRNNSPEFPLGSAWYNLACSLSRMNKTDKTYDALRNAILSGYPSIDNLRVDSDLVFIRRDPAWNARYSELKKLFDRGRTPLAAGKKLEVAVASTNDIYLVCRDGKAVLHRSISEIKDHKRYGTWKFNNYILTITWDRETGKKGVGMPTYCAAVCEYKSYSAFTRKIHEKETIRWQEVESKESAPWRVTNMTGPCGE